MSADHEDRSGSEAAGQACDYPWDEYGQHAYYQQEDDGEDGEVSARLSHLTGKASLGLAIASAEWLLRRFSRHPVPPLARQYLDAAWAGAVHEAYVEYVEASQFEWHGPVTGAIALAIDILNTALHDMGNDPDPSLQALWMYHLAHHVCPDPAPFDAWWEACLQRLERFHAVDVELAGYKPDLFENFPRLGSPVPREAYDPGRPYDPASNVALWDAFLRSLDPEDHPFLRSVADLEDFGELGAPPYRYTGPQRR
ncbi:hypothetical protein ACQ859_19455 [Roseateles chitinivorans]|uniref:hypothetical protein n=1 Tax=Roseateles chitinivorans TaxID=2917965 RepID=UPI003D6795F9